MKNKAIIGVGGHWYKEITPSKIEWFARPSLCFYLVNDQSCVYIISSRRDGGWGS